MALLYANNASSKLTGDITAVSTVLPVTAGDGAKFPNPTGGNTFMVTVQDSMGNLEIMSCTARTGDNLTVTRAQEGTTARTFSTGAVVANRFTAGSIASFNTYAMASNAEATAGTLATVLMNPANTKYFWDQRVTAFAATMLDDTNQAGVRTTLGLTPGTDVQAYDVNTMKSNVVTARTRAHRFTPVAVTSSAGALAIDCDLHEECTITLTENTTVGSATNQAAGKYVVIKIIGASTYTLAWNANYLKEGASALPTAPAAGKNLTVCFRSDGTNMRFIGSQLEA